MIWKSLYISTFTGSVYGRFWKLLAFPKAFKGSRRRPNAKLSAKTKQKQNTKQKRKTKTKNPNETKQENARAKGQNKTKQRY